MVNPNTHRFKYCPACGSAGIGPDSVKSVTCRDCQFKLYINVASAGMAVIFDDDQRVLVTRRKFEPYKGTLDFPGGFAEPGETMEACIIREIKEELNLAISNLRYFFSTTNDYLYQAITYPILDFVFICRVTDFTPISANDDISEFLFIPVNDLDPAQFGHRSPRTVVDTLKNQFNQNPEWQPYEI